MNPVDEYARLKDEIKGLEARALALRDGFLQPDARLRSNQFEVVIKRQHRRSFNKDLLPPDILNNPRYWTETSNPVVTVRRLVPEEGAVIEAF